MRFTANNARFLVILTVTNSGCSVCRTLLRHDFITSYPSVQDADIVSWMKGKYHPISPAKSKQDCGIQSSGGKSVVEVFASSEAIRESMLACSLALPGHLKQSLGVLFGDRADEQGMILHTVHCNDTMSDTSWHEIPILPSSARSSH